MKKVYISFDPVVNMTIFFAVNVQFTNELFCVQPGKGQMQAAVDEAHTRI